MQKCQKTLFATKQQQGGWYKLSKYEVMHAVSSKKNASGWRLTCICVSTSFWRVDTETLVPEAAHQNVAIVRCYHETLRVDLDALVHQIRDLPLVRPCVVGWDIAKT